MALIHAETDSGNGFHIVTAPTIPPNPNFAALAIDSAQPSELWGWQLSHDFPKHFESEGAIVLRSYRTVGGDRVFLPDLAEGWAGFVRLVARVGVAVLEQAGKTEEAQYHAVMITLFEKARHSREFRSRHFGSYYDLLEPENSCGVFPEGLGVASGNDQPGWSVSKLIEKGRESFEKFGAVEPCTAKYIAYGLHAAAMANPMVLPSSEEERLKVILNACFENSPGETVPQSLLEDIASEVAEVYRGRTKRTFGAAEGSEKRFGETDEEFLEWQVGGRSNFLQLVKGRVARSEKRWTASQVHAGVLEWYRRSLRYVGAAFSTAMNQWKAKAVEIKSLTLREERIFRLLYSCQSEYGRLPLVTLYDRFDILDPWLAEALRYPDAQKPEVFFTLMGYYDVMAGRRREIDRSKSNNIVINTELIADAPLSVAFGGAEGSLETAASEALESSDTLNILANRVGQHFGFSCNCSKPEWTGHSSTESDRLLLKCSNCSGEIDPELTPEQLRQFLSDDESP